MRKNVVGRKPAPFRDVVNEAVFDGVCERIEELLFETRFVDAFHGAGRRREQRSFPFQEAIELRCENAVKGLLEKNEIFEVLGGSRKGRRCRFARD